VFTIMCRWNLFCARLIQSILSHPVFFPKLDFNVIFQSRVSSHKFSLIYRSLQCNLMPVSHLSPSCYILCSRDLLVLMTKFIFCYENKLWIYSLCKRRVMVFKSTDINGTKNISYKISFVFIILGDYRFFRLIRFGNFSCFIVRTPHFMDTL
jgi:hypothetical protein